jgi:glycosyltransferase involved in cell wall biosynthesis
MSLGDVCQSIGTGRVVLVAILWIAGGVQVTLGLRRVRSLADVDPLPDCALPSLTVIAAAKDEGARIERALRSLLAQDYPALQIVFVDDRSVDDTGAILDRIAREHPTLRAIHVTELPAGWLGKCHALAQASADATSDWLLFTDGDIEFAPDAARRAVSLAIRDRAEHLAVAPELIVDSFGESIFIGHFLAMFYLSQQPWRASDPRSKSSIGIGAFNLVRRATYVAAGGHERIRFEVIDDLALGRILKHSGGRQLYALPGEKIRAKWHVGVRGLIRGVEKNAFAAFRYNVAVGFAAVVMQLALGWVPVLGFFLPGITSKIAATLAWVGILLVYAASVRGTKLKAWRAVLMPFGSLLFAFAIFRSIAITTARGGLTWRGTFYPLAELRRRMLP